LDNKLFDIIDARYKHEVQPQITIFYFLCVYRNKIGNLGFPLVETLRMIYRKLTPVTSLRHRQASHLYGKVGQRRNTTQISYCSHGAH